MESKNLLLRERLQKTDGTTGAVSHMIGVLQIQWLFSCAGVCFSQHYYAIATVIIYKSH